MFTVPMTDADFHLEHYDYTLPQGRIATYPLDERDHSKMMVIRRLQEPGAKLNINHAQFLNLPDVLEPGDLIVLNNTRVLQSRFYGRRLPVGRNRETHPQGAFIELLLLHPLEDAPENKPHQPLMWLALTKPAKRVKVGDRILLPGVLSHFEVFPVPPGHETLPEGSRLLKVVLDPSDFPNLTEPTIYDLMDLCGKIPIPPYMRRKEEDRDKETYQTVYATVPGSQAAPTAGLHFTDRVFDALKAKGVQTAFVTLDVGLGTFRPVSSEDIRKHAMHSEKFHLPPETVALIQQTKAAGKRVVAVGTTVVRTLETGVRMPESQGGLTACSGNSELFIYPGFEYRVVDAMLTNFHLPKSSLMMLVSAMIGRENLLDCYRVAIEQEYRFYSYGDCMMIL